jgi:pyruvate/2-oxoglutarate dehydrogenase complex dihydrolipoamide dehydrogenase (E3) component
VFCAEGISVCTGTAADRVTRNDEGVIVHLPPGEKTVADRLLVAAGREPVTGHLGLAG